MSAASRALEAEQATIAYQIALTKLGASVIADVMLLWRQDVPPTGGVSNAAAFMRAVTVLIRRKRGEARALARAYYRLDRALRTGYTVADPSAVETKVSLNDLRSQFQGLAGPEAPAPSPDNDIIPIETIPELDADAERLDRSAQEEVRVALGNLGPVALEKKLREIDPDRPSTEVDADRQKAHAEAEARVAAAAERIVVNGARGDVWNAASRDKRCIGYIRWSKTGTPCGWCAMLISRGPVYKSERSATTPEGYADGDLYHDNCNCIALPVYSTKDYAASDLYSLNREYQQMWPRVTKGLGGDAALTAWRRYIRTTQRAQAARTNTQNAQEA